MYRKSSHSKAKKILWIILGILLIVAISFAVYQYVLNDKNTENQESASNVNKVNYDPPTEEEQSAGDKQKEEITELQDTPDTLPNEAEVIIVDASQYDNEIEVRAFVANVIQDGECIITFEKEGVIIEKTVPAYADASTTPCIALTLPRSEFTSTGAWDLNVTYKNDKIMGVSQDKIEIQ